MGNDMMNPSDFFNIVNSGLNLKLMEDYGHFVANFNMEEHLSWGLGVGCDAFSEDCSQVPMTCPVLGEHLCSPDYYSMGICTTDTLAESCNIFHEEVFSDCRHEGNQLNYTVLQESDVGTSSMYFGPGGRCIMGKISSLQSRERGSCVETRCDSSTTVTIFIQGTEVECRSYETGTAKSIVPDGSLYIICPDVFEMCRTEHRCPNDCSENGRCLKSGQCWCYFGFEGSDCSTASENTVYKFTVAGSIRYPVLLVLGILALYII